MRLEDLQVEIRPRTPGQTVALAARMVQRRPGPLLAAWGLYTGAVVALSALMLISLELPPFWTWTIILLVAPLFSLPLTATTGHLVFSPAVSLCQIARLTSRRGFVFAPLFLLSRVLVVAGLLLFVVPGLFFWRGGWFLGPIVLLEGSSLAASFRRGRRFALGFQGQVLKHACNALALLIYLTIAGASLLHFAITALLVPTLPPLGNLALQEWYGHLIGLAGFGLAAPFVTLSWFFVYLDVRARKEGWDLEIAFRRRAARMERSHA